MVQQTEIPLDALYLEDETAWLEAMARFVAERRWSELDHKNLSEYLSDMSRRDMREVLSRLTVLLAHLLKWEQQPELRTSSWRSTMLHQREELRDLLESGTLAAYADESLPRAFDRAVQHAAVETGIPIDQLPAVCPWTIDELISEGQ